MMKWSPEPVGALIRSVWEEANEMNWGLHRTGSTLGLPGAHFLIQAKDVLVLNLFFPDDNYNLLSAILVSIPLQPMYSGHVVITLSPFHLLSIFYVLITETRIIVQQTVKSSPEKLDFVSSSRLNIQHFLLLKILHRFLDYFILFILFPSWNQNTLAYSKSMDGLIDMRETE